MILRGKLCFAQIITIIYWDRSLAASVPGISENLVVKRKLPPRSGSNLEAVETHP